MLIRPDLFDPHTVHYHGFPNVAAIFDGMPDSAISINMGNSLTYFYDLVEPGTFMYHCHVEAAEHMQMGMLGNLYVAPKQNNDAAFSGDGLNGYAYNDTDGSTGYHVEYPVQIASFDPVFHDNSEAVQPLPFAEMHDTYPMLNGRGYPDTKNAGNVLNAEGFAAQNVPTNITAAVGQKILLRVSSLATTEFYTLTTLGIPMKVVGNGSRILRGNGEVAGADLSYTTNSVTLGGGETMEIILDTTGLSAGTYFLYSTDLNQLSNNTEDFGGMMTEIVLTAPI
jgi:FtsP/CotA-like multicopper oxidase with cupredoxin domain